MGNLRAILFGFVWVLALSSAAGAEQFAPSLTPTPEEAAAIAATNAAKAAEKPQPIPLITSAIADDPVLVAVRAKLAPPATPAAATPLAPPDSDASDLEVNDRDLKDRDAKDRAALAAFYAARHGDGLWVTAAGLKPEAKLLSAEIANAGN